MSRNHKYFSKRVHKVENQIKLFLNYKHFTSHNHTESEEDTDKLHQLPEYPSNHVRVTEVPTYTNTNDNSYDNLTNSNRNSRHRGFKTNRYDAPIEKHSTNNTNFAKSYNLSPNIRFKCAGLRKTQR